MLQQQNPTQMFGLLPEGERRLGSLFCGYMLECAFLAVVGAVLALAPAVIDHRHYRTVELVAPVAEAIEHKPQPEIKAPPAIVIRAPRFQTTESSLTAPVLVKPEVARLDIPVAPAMPVEAKHFDSVVPVKDEPKNVRLPVQTAGFGSSATPTLSTNNPAKVQTGGFGDPNGLPASKSGVSGRPNIAAVGSFDLPVGEGHGNGTGGKRGASGAIASAGFGNGVAIESRRSKSERVQLTSFGAPAPVAETRQTASVKQIPITTPVEIQSKPQPVYTVEARRLGLEGDVVIQALFTSDGKVKVLRMVRGLGHGLDEAAIRAVEGIVFKPAQSNGQAVDSTATLHVVFQLS